MIIYLRVNPSHFLLKSLLCCRFLASESSWRISRGKARGRVFDKKELLIRHVWLATSRYTSAASSVTNRRALGGTCSCINTRRSDEDTRRRDLLSPAGKATNFISRLLQELLHRSAHRAVSSDCSTFYTCATRCLFAALSTLWGTRSDRGKYSWSTAATVVGRARANPVPLLRPSRSIT